MSIVSDMSSSMHSYLTRNIYSIFVFTIFLLGNSFTTKAQPLIPATDTMFNRYYPNLTVFIGTPVPGQLLNKDSSAQWPNDPFMVDGVLRVKYLVKEWVYGIQQPPDTLEMISYDHYGAFPFLESKYAMLYAYQNKNGNYTQYRYKYHSVYPTIGGGWAGPPETWRWFRDSNHLVPRVMPYVDSVRISMHVFEDSMYFPDELANIRESYPDPYYYLNRFDVVTMYGNEVLELFNYEKGLLIEQAIFDEKYVDENGVVSIPDVELSMVNEVNSDILPAKPKLSFNQFKQYILFKNSFIKAIKANDTVMIKALLLPEIWVCDSVFVQKAFIDKFMDKIQIPFSKYKDFNYNKFKNKQWKAGYKNDRNYFVVLKDSLGNEFNYYMVKPNLQFSDVKNELFVIETYILNIEHDHPHFYLHFVLKEGRFFLYGMHFPFMRQCYR
jgi:hypothetical protein